MYIYSCSFVGLDNKLYNMHGTYIKMFSYNPTCLDLTAIFRENINIDMYWSSEPSYDTSTEVIPEEGNETEKCRNRSRHFTNNLPC